MRRAAEVGRVGRLCQLARFTSFASYLGCCGRAVEGPAQPFVPVAETTATRRGGRLGEHPSPRGTRPNRSIAATPRSRQLLEQVPPRRLQELVALDDAEQPSPDSGELQGKAYNSSLLVQVECHENAVWVRHIVAK